MKNQYKYGICKVLGRSVVVSVLYADLFLCLKSVIIITLIDPSVFKIYQTMLYIYIFSLE